MRLDFLLGNRLVIAPQMIVKPLIEMIERLGRGAIELAELRGRCRADFEL